MTLYDLRVWIESSVPLWLYLTFIIAPLLYVLAIKQHER